MSPREVVEEWIARFNAADSAGLSALYHDEAVNHQVPQEPVEGKAAIREMFERELAAAEMTCIPEVIHEAGDVAILEWRDPMGLRGCGFFTVKDGRTAYQRGYWDKLSFLNLHGLPVGEGEASGMELIFNVAARIARPVSEVFEAVAAPEHLSRYFTTGGARGRMGTGATVYWDFHDVPGEFPVKIVDVERNARIVFQWAAGDGAEAEAGGYDTTVTMTFTPLEDGRTAVTVSEEGWRRTPAGLKASYGNCQGWTQMLCALKAYLEHGINLREGMFK